MLNFHLVTLFPEFFDSPLSTGLLGRAKSAGLINFTFHNPRDFSSDKHRRVDDAPFGGGPGMVIRAQPMLDAALSIPNPGRILLASPQGRPLTSDFARELAKEKDVSIICGRYEGIDARLAQFLPLEPVSVGDVILNGGETAALAIIESACRFAPGFLGARESAEEDSFSSGLLEYPQYTRPETFQGIEAPQILLSGNHQAVAAWRRKEALLNTLELRPKLLDQAPLNESDAKILASFSRARRGRSLSFCLCHYPVILEKGKIGTSSLTNLDAHDISRISRAYGMGPFFVLTPLRDQLDLLKSITSHWTKGPGAASNPDRAQALALVQPVADYGELDKKAREYYGTEPAYLAASAKWIKKSCPLTCEDALKICASQPVIILLGTARGLDLKSLPIKFGLIRPLRFLSENHLSVRGAAAIIADRILGDYN